MRYFLLLTLALLTTPAMAAPITKQMANGYYNNCVSKKAEQKLTKESQEFLCGCTADKMVEHMTTEDIIAMNNSADLPAARNAMNNMLINVYAPCMEAPVRDHYYNTCVTNPDTAKLGKNAEQICACMSDEIGAHLGKNGEEIFEGILKRNPNVADPFGALEADPNFQKFAKDQGMKCLIER